MADSKQVEELKTFSKFYDLLLIWKEDKSENAITSLKVLLDELGFWPPPEKEETKYTAPYFPDRLSFVLSAPEGWKFGAFPVEGEYKFAIIYQNGYGEGERKWEIKVRQFSLEKDTNAYLYDSMSSYLFPFIANAEDLMLPSQRRMPLPDSPDYANAKIQLDQEAYIRAECLKMIPELTHHTWPDTLIIEGAWEEKPFDHPDFFKKTMELISGEFHPVLKDHWDIPFESIIWSGNSASITQKVAYSILDQHAERMYGIKGWIESEKETGIWLTKDGDTISFEAIRPSWTHNSQYETKGFFDLSGELTNNQIKISTISYSSKEGKDLIWNYFLKHGLRITNIPTPFDLSS